MHVRVEAKGGEGGRYVEGHGRRLRAAVVGSRRGVGSSEDGI